MEIIVGLSLLLVFSVSAKNSEIVKDIIEEKKNSTPQCDDNLFPYLEQLEQWDVHEADVFEFPYHVGVVTVNKRGFKQLLCQGALITPLWFITAANCILLNLESAGNATWTAVMGTVNFKNPKAVVRKLSYYVYHPQFNKKTGVGIDLAMWMLEKPIDTFVLYPKPVKLYNINNYIKTDCSYSSYVGEDLYGNTAHLSKEIFCELMGVVDDARHCVVMNNTIHDRVKIEVTAYELGAPITCRGTLYGIRNKRGYFTTVIFKKTRKWVYIVVDQTAQHIADNSIQNVFIDDNSKELDYFKLDLNPDDTFLGSLRSSKELKLNFDAIENGSIER
ncbi:Peptidase S1, PA clan,Serine proteases, trypsin domain [Cinara cedri]|uniref:Peptidase S1, PA clan,Serine proteases, trypsin domain n=1 Tax=Cinara cedri TaxID=506608 RepID=A0A5E4NDW4_9HEMI|nr:Peptidase S1, PA clan,Serine proteases, trypsin domain [Cinara cedri]